MHLLTMLPTLLTSLLALTTAVDALRSGTTRPESSPSRNAIQLSKVKSLTLHAGRQTSHRRVSAVPQLECVGPSAKICGLYTPDVMRCVNAGSGDGGEEDIAWTCEAELPVEFKLGSTDVICEGYRDAEDEWVLKGSCGVRYRMLLTEEGERRFGKGGPDEPREKQSWGQWIGNILFFAIFICVALVIFSAAMGWFNPGQGGGRGNGWGGDGGPGGPGPFDDPPPPYEDVPRKGTRSAARRNYGTGGRSSRSAWTPGFWSGAGAGAAAGAGAGYFAGRRGNGGSRWGNGGEGSSSSSPSPPSSFGQRHESTGFGSTSRR